MIEEIRNNIKKVFEDLEFQAKSHIYYLNGRSIPSTSRQIKKHSEPFNSVKWSKIIAKKRGRTPEEIVAEWGRKRDMAAANGTRIHDFAERLWEHDDLTPSCSKEEAAKSFIEFVKKDEDLEFVSCELQMYSDAYQYAGTTDLVLRRKSTGKIIIVDYKTNENLDKTYQKLLAPFDFLDNNPFNKYQLQLSYYQIMFEEKTKMEVEERWIIWLRESGSYEIRKTENFTTHLIDYMNNGN